MKLDGTPAPWLFMGATGRVGSLLQAAWALHPPPRELLTQGRHGDVDIRWDPLNEPNADSFLAALEAARGRQLTQVLPPEVAFVFLGATPSGSGAMPLNVELVRAAISAAAAARVSRVFIASSAAVYGNLEAGNWSENDLAEPVSDYGRSKLAAESEAAKWRNQGLDICCLRIGNVFAADMLFGNILTNRSPASIKLDRFADGTSPQRSYLDAVTLAAALEALAQVPSPLPKVLNVAASKSESMENMLVNVGLNFEWRAAPSSAIQYATLDCTLLESLIDPAILAVNAETMVRNTRKLGKLDDV